jgi:hypothetical protein
LWRESYALVGRRTGENGRWGGVGIVLAIWHTVGGEGDGRGGEGGLWGGSDEGREESEEGLVGISFEFRGQRLEGRTDSVENYMIALLL